jgi:hypothetical protein
MKKNLRANACYYSFFLSKYWETVQIYLLILYTIIIAISVQLISCTPTGYTAADPVKNKQIALACSKYITGNPDYFQPPDQPGDLPTTKYTDGCVAWTPSIAYGNPPVIFNIDNYLTRLKNATISQQTSWDQYLRGANCGFPGYVVDPITQNPPQEYQAGFVCYAIVYNALKDAGFADSYWGIGTPLNCDAIVQALDEVTDYNDAKIGDIVAYQWIVGPSVDHIGVITSMNGTTNPKENWKVISCIGTSQVFNWGAKPTKLGVFGNQSDGGLYTNWPDIWKNWTFKIYRAN